MAWAEKKDKNQKNRLYLTRAVPLARETWLPVFEAPMLAATKIWNACV